MFMNHLDLTGNTIIMRLLVTGILLLTHFITCAQIKIVPQSGHFGAITHLTLSKDGQFVATASVDKTIKVWDIKKGVIVHDFQRAQLPVNFSVFGQEDEFLYSTDQKGKILQWRLRKNNIAATSPTATPTDAYALRQAKIRAGGSQKTGNFEKQMHGKGSIINCDISPDRKFKLACNTKNEIMCWGTGATIKFSIYTKFNSLKTAFFDKTGKKIYGIAENRVQVWKVDGVKPSGTFPLSSSIDEVAINGNKSIIATTDKNGTISLFSIGKFKKLQTISLTGCKHLNFSNSNNTLYFMSNNTLYQYNVDKATLINLINTSEEWNMIIVSPQAKMAIGIVKGNELVAISLKGDNGQQVYRKPSLNLNYEKIIISPDWKHIVNTNGEKNYLQISDLPGAKTELFFTKSPLLPNTVSIDNHMVSVVTKDNKINLYELRNFNLKHSITTPRSNVEGTVTDAFHSRVLTWEKSGKIEIYNTESGHHMKSIDLQIGISSFKVVGSSMFIVTCDNGSARVYKFNEFSADKYLHTYKCKVGSRCAMSSNKNFIAFQNEKNNIEIYNYYDDFMVNELITKDKKDIAFMNFSEDGAFFAAVYTNGIVRIYDTEKGTVINRRSKGKRLCIPHPITFSQDNKMLFIVNEDHMGLLWSWDTRRDYSKPNVNKSESEHKFIFSPEGTLLLSTNNYYIASGKGSKLLGFRKKGEFYPIEQFDLLFNRPDKVLQKLSVYNDTHLINIYNKAYKKRLERLGLKNSRSVLYHLPTIEVLNANELGAVSSTKKITLNIKADDSKARLKIKVIKVYINGVPVNPEKGKIIDSKAVKPIEASISFELNTGDNIIEVSCINSGGVESLKEILHIKCIAPATTPTIHVFSIGSSNYQDSYHNLNFAAKDAEDFIKAISNDPNRKGDIRSYSLLNEKVTKENIKKVFDELKFTSVDDYVYIFYAGHGQLDTNFNFHMATYDMDFNQPATNGLSYNDLELWLEYIPSRHKVLFIDACHSGEIDKMGVTTIKFPPIEKGEVKFRAIDQHITVQRLNDDLNTMKELFNDLEYGSGTTIISSAGGNEFAIEGGDWNNGVFTYYLKLGIEQNHADLNKDNKIMLSELFKYLSHIVPKATRGNQQPTSRSMNLVNDLVLKVIK